MSDTATVHDAASTRRTLCLDNILMQKYICIEREREKEIENNISCKKTLLAYDIYKYLYKKSALAEKYLY